MEEGKIETFLKGKIDHGDMDKRWTLNRLKNDSKLVDEMEKLREAKKELRDFENNIDSELVRLFSYFLAKFKETSAIQKNG